MSGFMTGTVVKGLMLDSVEEAASGADVVELVHGLALDVLATGLPGCPILEDEASITPCCCTVVSALVCGEGWGLAPPDISRDMPDNKASISWGGQILHMGIL